MPTMIVIIAIAIALVGFVLLRPRRRASLDRIAQATARRGQPASAANDHRGDPGLALAVRHRALADQIAALGHLVAVPQQHRIGDVRRRELEQLHGEALACAAAIEASRAAPATAPAHLLEQAVDMTERLRAAVLAARSNRILGNWKDRHLAEISRVEALAARREAAAEAELRIEADANKLKARIR